MPNESFLEERNASNMKRSDSIMVEDFAANQLSRPFTPQDDSKQIQGKQSEPTESMPRRDSSMNRIDGI